MSAAAIPSKPKKDPKRSPEITQEQFNEEIDLKKERGYGATPNTYFDELVSRLGICTEWAVVGLILRNTWGGDFAIRDSNGQARGRERSGRPAWAPLNAARASKLLRVTPDAVEEALRQAESHGYIVSAQHGREKWYRVEVQNFAKGDKKEQRKVEKKPAERDTNVRSVEPHERLILYPGTKARPIRLSDDLEARFHNSTSIPLAVLAPEIGAGFFKFTIEEFLDAGQSAGLPEGEHKANDTRSRDHLSVLNGNAPSGEKQANDRRSRDHLSGGRGSLKNGEEEANNRWSRDHLFDERPVDNKRNPIVKTPELGSSEAEAAVLGGTAENQDFSLLRDLIIRWCGSDLGTPSDKTVDLCLTALAGAPREDFAARLNKRVPELKFLTWKIVSDIAKDVGREFTKRSRAAGHVEEQIALSPEDRAELEEFTKRQRERFSL